MPRQKTQDEHKLILGHYLFWRLSGKLNKKLPLKTASFYFTPFIFFVAAYLIHNNTLPESTSIVSSLLLFFASFLRSIKNMGKSLVTIFKTLQKLFKFFLTWNQFILHNPSVQNIYAPKNKNANKKASKKK